MPYRNVNSVRYGLRYGGPTGGGFTRVVFTASDPAWFVPAGVTSIDILAVGGGAGGSSGGDGSERVGGPGGGGVVVANGVAVNPGDTLSISVGQGGTGDAAADLATVGGDSIVTNLTTVTQLVQAGPGGVGAGLLVTAMNGLPDNGNGGGGGYYSFSGSFAAGVGNGTGFDGGAEDVGGGGFQAASGGGAGAGGNGSPGVAGIPNGIGGDGGPGVIPPPSSFGPWGTDIGENGYFGGGGPGRNGINFGDWLVANRGIGGGAPNTGGAGRPTDAPAFGGEDGYSGIVVIMYATP